jgi:16S rRNA (guanine527-N7)-methyltransferase
MHNPEPLNLLADGARQLGIPLAGDQLRQFQVYLHTLLAWNARMNLTGITDDRAVQLKHFLDSLAGLPALRQAEPLAGWPAGRVIDVGSGAGFPGVPLKIAWPGLRLTLLEATGKKAEFLRALVQHLGMAGVEVLNARAEDAAHQPAHRQAYDLAVARALAEMATLAELTLPFVRTGGLVAAYKGEDPSAEVARAENAIARLGGRLRRIMPVTIPGLAAARHLVVLEKVAVTPERYPRRPGMPARHPLR